MRQHSRTLIFLLLVTICGGAGHAALAASETQVEHLICDGFPRSYRLRLPSDLHQPRPLVMLLHGGFGSAEQAERTYGFDAVADAHQIIMVYPDGLGRRGHNHWNDGRGVVWKDQTTDDVHFLLEVLKAVQARCAVDANRIYCCGISNGAMMTERMAAQRQTPFAAIACVAGTLPVAIDRDFAAISPVSVLIIHGTKDSFVPYAGGTLNSGGVVTSVADTVSRWCRLDGISGPPTTTQLPDVDGEDGSRVERDRYPLGAHGAQVECYRVVGGGHTWPGAPGSAIFGLAGAVNEDIDASAVMWGFFAAHPRQQR